MQIAIAIVNSIQLLLVNIRKFYELSKNNEIDLEAIHINHNLNDQSKLWENHCRNFCKKTGIKLHVSSAEIIKSGGGLESAARGERYKIFENIIDSEEQILTAHHQDDVALTFSVPEVHQHGYIRRSFEGTYFHQKVNS